MTNPVTTTPKHLWAVGIFALLFDGMGVLDFVMTQTKNAECMGNFTPEQLEYFYGFPRWLVVIWAAAVFGGVLASVLLLMRKALATNIYAISLGCMVGSNTYLFGFSDGAEVMGNEGLIFTVVIFIVSLGLVLYSRAMQRAGVLT
ncbi:MAG TPA: hypothetical protein EYQ25_02315 [Planctomycetes bacterium]|nr:hypothetical protein [Planctomycetota bacterium]HIL38773.1 hypothetical protein [Planctomycetota bacterium]